MVPIWVSDPMGLARPLRMASTPATNVVATAPMPGIMTPSLPLAGSMVPWLVFGTRLFTATGSGGELHFTAGSLGMGKSGLTMLVLAGCGRIGELLAMTAAVGIPPVGHEYSRAFLIHESSFWWRWLATATNWT